MDELRELVRLIADGGFTDFELEREGFRVRLRREVAPQTIQAPASNTQASAAPTAASNAPTGNAVVTSTNAGAPSQQNAASSSQQQTASSAQTSDAASASTDESLQLIPSPIVGTFYRAPSPTSDPFVRLGSRVDPDTVVCIIEAMKLMNEIQAEMSGEIAKIYVENGQPVEYGQPLFGIKK